MVCVTFQDTLAAMEALFEFTLVDPNRNVFSMDLKLESSASPEWNDAFMMTKDNYTEMQEVWVGISPSPSKQITGSDVADITAKIFIKKMSVKADILRLIC